MTRMHRIHATANSRIGLAACQAVVAACAVMGAAQLFLDVATPPESSIEPLGLASWRLPACWLLATVGVPFAIAAVGTWTAAPWARTASLLASGLLLLELLVQIPFLGPNALQWIFGLAALALASWAWHLGDTRRSS